MLFGQPRSEDSPRVAAPDFHGLDGWLNTDKPLRMADLRGRVVLLDFWTYCCINCLHVIPDLQYLEDKYRDEPFVVIGVHSGKFSQEKDPENIRQAILRHNIAHPVAVDSDYQVWNAYAVHAWPTLVLIDPEGYVVGQVSGEGHRGLLDRTIARLLAQHRLKGTLAGPMTFRADREAFQPGVLQFPGKVLADEDRPRLFISDTNHHRVLVADQDGKVNMVIGSGSPGRADGPFADARFHQPQGLALSSDGDTLYIADTGNHLIRAADLRTGRVTTVAGTGEQTRDYAANGPAQETAISSPWDLARVDTRLFIAMAGTHQIWVLDLAGGRVSAFAGTGREARIDGPNHRAAFAQPSGLATNGRRLFVADSEISTIRWVEVDRAGRTGTLAGSGGLFDFGHRDAAGDKALFQHPLGVALQGEYLFVADTFNHLIRRVRLSDGQTTTWLGTGKPDVGTPDDIGLFEPGGISVAGNTLYIADTNHHRVLAADLQTRAVRVLDVTFSEAATHPAR
ncbi:MAG: redoxin domain-containing protein [Phycisphaerae bacterium]|nr:redoxin domain-containing protein [Phycisphaerae bacterium]